MNEKIYPIVVIGGGAAGVMASLRSILNNDETLFFPGSPKHRKKSRAFWVSKVENMPGFQDYKKGVVEPHKNTIGWIENSNFKDKFFHQKNRGIQSISKNSDGLFELIDNKDEKYICKNVVLCTGVMDVQPEINGEIKDFFPYANAQTIDYCLICDGHHSLNKLTTVIGHNSGAAWVSVMLHERYQPPAMSILTNGEETNFDEGVTKLVEKYDIKVYKSKIKEIRGDRKTAVLEGYELEDGTFVPSDFGFVSLGMIVYNELAVQLGADLDNRGFVITNEKGLTNIEGLYVAGDMRANAKNQIYTAWDHAVDSVNHINGKLRTERREL
jgi:thioredoxin reductase (NADPH)